MINDTNPIFGLDSIFCRIESKVSSVSIWLRALYFAIGPDMPGEAMAGLGRDIPY